MIKRAFYLNENDLKYYVGINQIHIDFRQFSKDKNKEKTLEYLFGKLEKVQNNNKNSTIQFIKDKYVLNEDHIYIASYYVEKAFISKTNISNKKNIELFLYLSSHRQISKAIDSFGIDYSDLKKGKLTICIISPKNNLTIINQEIVQLLKANEIEIMINNLTNEKIRGIIDYFEISGNQIKAVLNSYGKGDINDIKNNLKSLALAISDLIYEKMALLNLEQIRRPTGSQF